MDQSAHTIYHRSIMCYLSASSMLPFSLHDNPDGYQPLHLYRSSAEATFSWYFIISVYTTLRHGPIRSHRNFCDYRPRSAGSMLSGICTRRGLQCYRRLWLNGLKHPPFLKNPVGLSTTFSWTSAWVKCTHDILPGVHLSSSTIGPGVQWLIAWNR